MASGSPNRYIFDSPNTGGGVRQTVTPVDTTELRIKQLIISLDADLGTRVRVTWQEGVVEDGRFADVGPERSEVFAGAGVEAALSDVPSDPTRTRLQELEALVFQVLRQQGKIAPGTFTEG